MRCLICGQLSLPGAKLCLDCKAARKRAFDATVTQPLLAAAGEARGSMAAPQLLRPSQSVPDAARRAAKMALAAQAQARIAIESPPRRVAPWPIIVGIMCIAVVAVGYFGHWFGSGKSDTLAAEPVAPTPAYESPAAPSISVPMPGPTASPPTAAATVPAKSNAAAVQPSTVATTADAAKRPNVRPRVEKAPVTLPAPEPTLPPVIAVPRAPPPPVVREAPRPDRWQLMTDAIARCPRDDISGRALCEQRLRTQACEGYWGQVPQCASIPYVDHGG